MGVSFPNNQIFEGTFRQNILMGRDIDDKEISHVLQILKLEDYIVSQQKGIDSLVDSGGRRLPRSIIQKILVARIIIGQPKLLLMEDPLLFIEDEEKKRIIDYIMDEDRNWTTIVVSDFYYWKERSNKTIDLSNN
jgi:ABC-type multidrug transport system fused ATPase/permease subunit